MGDARALLDSTPAPTGDYRPFGNKKGAPPSQTRKAVLQREARKRASPKGKINPIKLGRAPNEHSTLIPKAPSRLKDSKQFSPDNLDAILSETGDRPDTEQPRRMRSTTEATEYRRAQIHRLLLRGVPRQTIAEHLGISMETLYSDTKAITAELRREVTDIDYAVYIGTSTAFFDECRNIALRLATDKGEKSNGVKMTALRTAIEAEKAKHEFFSRVGLFKIVNPTDPFNGINTGKHGSYTDENNINGFLQLIAKAASGEVVLTEEDLQGSSRVVSENNE